MKLPWEIVLDVANGFEGSIGEDPTAMSWVESLRYAANAASEAMLRRGMK